MEYERRAGIPNGPEPQAGFGARGRLHGVWGASPGLLNAGGEQGAGSPLPKLSEKSSLDARSPRKE